MNISNSSISVNTLRPRQNGRHFADAIFKCNFLNENVWIPIKTSLKFVPKGQINNIPALTQIMAWRRSGDEPLSEPMMVSLLMHIYVTRPQWNNTGYIMTVPDHSDYICKHLKFATVTVLFSIQHQFTDKFQLNISINSRIRCGFFPNHELLISLLQVKTQNLTIHKLTDRHFLVY